MKTLRYCVSSWCAGPQTEAENLAMGHHSPRIAKEDGEQVVFFRREFDRRPVAGDETLVEVHDDAFDLHALNGLGRLGRVSQCGSEACGQFTDAERLLYIIVSAKIERLDLLRLAIARGEHDHRRRQELADIAQNVLTVPIGQAEVENDEIRRAGRSKPQSLGAGLGRLHVKAGGGERDGEKPLNLWFVINDKNAWARHAAGLDAIGVNGAAGSRTTNRVPRRRTAGLCATIVPPIASTRRREMERPSPVPALRPSDRPPR